jgi:hypothetical protein
MKKTVLLSLFLFLLPVLLLLEIGSITVILSLISAASDMAFLFGVFCLGVFLVANYFLINYIIKIFKTKTK